MPSFRRVALWVTALSLMVSVQDARADRVVLRLDALNSDPWSVAPDTLLEPLNAWLDTQLEYPRREVTPTIRLVDPSEARDIQGPVGRMTGPMRGLYDPENATIYLVRPWTADDPTSVSVLLHELVHHRQTGARHFFCPGAQEPEAYALQEAWLAERGIELNINRIAVVLEGGCTRTDFHPD